MDELQNNLKYRKVKGISRGGFGFVDLAENRQTGELVAIKFIERGEKVAQRTERQILNHQALVHPHVVQLIEVFLTPSYLAVVMEYVQGGTLLDYVLQQGRLTEEEARWYFQQLIIAVDYLHSKEIANRDIKLCNVLMFQPPSQRPLLKLCGFGVSKHERFHSAPASLVGTAEYLAPEVIKSDGSRTYNGRVADVWSCGVMLYRMVVGAYPFERSEEADDPQRVQKMAARILGVEYQIPEGVQLSQDLENLLRRMLAADPCRRISVAEILATPWFREGLPPGVIEMNAQLPAGANPDKGQDVYEVKSILKEAQAPVAPVHIWDDTDFLEDHELHGMDSGDLDEFINSIVPAC